MPSKRYVYPDTLAATFRDGQERLDAMHEAMRSIQDRVDNSNRVLTESRETLRKMNRRMESPDSRTADE